MKNEESENDVGIPLKVMQSKIGAVDSGIARVHSSYLEDIELGENSLVTIRTEEHSITAKLVADKLAEKKKVVLREGDMNTLKIEEGDEVTMEPYTSLGDDIKEMWGKLKEKFKKDDEEDEDEKEEDA